MSEEVSDKDALTLIHESEEIEKTNTDLQRENDALKAEVTQLKSDLKKAQDSLKEIEDKEVADIRTALKDSYSKEELEKMKLPELRIANDAFKRIKSVRQAVPAAVTGVKSGDSRGWTVGGRNVPGFEDKFKR